MMRIVSVWLPQWPIERLKREREANRFWQALDEGPFVLVETGERGLIVSATNAAALAQGLAPGLGFADARARCPHLRSAAADAVADARGLIALARWCGRYSPALNVDGTDGLWIDTGGVAHLFGGEAAMLGDLRARLASLGLTARAAVADTFGAAWALARYGSNSPPPAALKRGHPPHQKEGGNLAQVLAPLPVEALRLAPETALLLRRLGLKRIGQLYALTRGSLARRFTSREVAEAVLVRLDQALGLRSEPLAPLQTPPRYTARAAFPEPLISGEAFETELAKLAETLCAELARDLKGARSIAFAAYRADGSQATLKAGLSTPCRSPAHMLRLLREKTDALDLGFGVDVMTLAALAVERRGGEQAAFAERGAKPAPDLLIDRLSNRLGAGRVLWPERRASHIPERAQAWTPALAGEPAHADVLPVRAPRPPLLLERPEPIAVLAEIPEGPPARFTWRRVTRRVVRAQGPERIAPEWWRDRIPASGDTGGSSRPAAPRRGLPPHQGEGGEFVAALRTGRTRDYYRIEDEAGGRYWVFREGLYGSGEDGAPGWYLHGMMG